jgi:hypothetical protein
MTDVGFDREHAMFGNPVVYNSETGQGQRTSDLFRMRIQVALLKTLFLIGLAYASAT